MRKFALGAIIALMFAFIHIDNVKAYTDTGNAPAPYGTATHTGGSVYNRLGNVMSVDDGVTFTSPLPANYNINYTITAAFGTPQGYLDAWIDWNQDYDWNDSGEHVYDSGYSYVGSGSFSNTIPAGALTGTTWMRVRLFYMMPADSSTGTANWGEVEDYQVSLGSGQQQVVFEPTTIALLGTGLLGMLGYNWRRRLYWC